MFPVITLQFFGVAYTLRSRKVAKEMATPTEETIIDLDYSSNQADMVGD